MKKQAYRLKLQAQPRVCEENKKESELEIKTTAS